MFEYETDEIDLFKEMYNNADKSPVKVAENNLTSFASGINSIDRSNINLFPNPIQETLFIESDFPFEVVELTNINGQLMQTDQNIQHDLRKSILKYSYSAGVYFVTLKYKNRPIGSKKIIITD